MSFEGLKHTATASANDYHEEFTMVQIANKIKEAARVGKYSIRVKSEHVYIYSIDTKLKDQGFKLERIYNEEEKSYKYGYVDISWE